MKGIAVDFDKRIKRMGVINKSSIIIFDFKDGSQLTCDMAKRSVRVTGGENSDANKFGSSVKTFQPIETRIEFIFIDETKLEYNFEGAMAWNKK